MRAALPVAPKLYGRDGDLARVEAALGRSRIVTLWGPGGIGKTSLALVVARAARGAGTDVVWAPLAADRDAFDVLRTIARAIGADLGRSRVPDDAAARIGATLAKQSNVLLVLDDVEAVADEIARRVVAWTAEAPHARFLVTSREPIGVRDEVVLEVPPLDVSTDAEALFLARARATAPDFSARPELIAAIARRTEGIPLAIELCAARLDVLTAEQLAIRLAESPAVLRSSRRDIDAKHRTLVASIDASYQLLDDVERRALSDVALFAGTWDLDAAEAIVLGARPTLDLIESLVRKSLVRRVADGFTLFESIRTFVRDVAPATEAARARHARYFADRAAAAHATLDSIDAKHAQRALELFEADLAVVAASFERAPSEAATALLALQALGLVRGPVGAFVGRATPFLDAAVDPTLHARVASALGETLLLVGRPIEARAMVTSAVASLRRADARHDLALALFRLGEIASESGDYQAVASAEEEAIAIATASGHEAIAGLARGRLGAAQHVDGDLGAAGASYEASRALLRAAGHARGEARTLSRIAFLHYDEGRWDEARTAWQESLALSETLGDERMRAYVIGYLGNAARATLDVAEAERRYTEAIAVMQRTGDRVFETVFTMDLAILHLLAADPERARAELATCIAGAGALITSLVDGYRAVASAFAGDEAAARDALGQYVDETPERAPGIARECIATHTRTVAVLRGDALAIAEARAVLAEPPRHQAEHVRLARLLLARAVDRAAPPDDAIAIDRAATRVRPPGGEWIDLDSRPSLARIVFALADAHRASPGTPSNGGALLTAGWPGERVRADAGAIRVRVAIATLRKLGFDRVLLRERAGYLFAPTLRVVETVTPTRSKA